MGFLPSFVAWSWPAHGRALAWAGEVAGIETNTPPAVAREKEHLLIFILAYLAMIPCANLVGFAGQELALKLPHVAGVLIETT